MSSQVSGSVGVVRRVGSSDTLEALLTAGDVELRAVGHEALTVRTVAARAGVSPATAYTYLASKHHLFAQLFARYLAEEDPAPVGTDVVARVQAVTRHLAARLAAAPELAAAVTPALLSSDADVALLRLRIGVDFAARFQAALAGPPEAPEPVAPAVLDALLLAFSGALLQAGMGLLTYEAMGERLDAVVATIVHPHETRTDPR